MHRRDGVEYALRVGLNSGAVVTGQIGVDPTSYTAVGAQVRLAQRMESAAPPGGVMVSESTARPVQHTAVLGDPQLVEIKGSATPIPARLLKAMGPRRWPQLRHESALVGRDSENFLHCGVSEGCPCGPWPCPLVSGPPGIGKSRICRELAELADNHGVKTYSTFCESHARDMPFYVIARLLRDVFQVGDLDDVAARGKIRARLGSADPEDVQLLENFSASGDSDCTARGSCGRAPSAPVPPGGFCAVGRDDPAVLIVEDVHWIDDVSEAMLTEVLGMVPQTSTIAAITYRPEYRGPLHYFPDTARFVLAPLDDSQAAKIAKELMGADPSLSTLTAQIIGRAAGNPFFVHELIRDLAERKIIDGQAGAYVRRGEVADVAVPPTLQAAIASRIDRLTTGAKQLLNAAAVVGSQFASDLLANISERERDRIQPELSELVHAELIYPVVLTSSTEYAFRHPMIRTVAQESQLKTGRSALHRRLADAIEYRNTRKPTRAPRSPPPTSRRQEIYAKRSAGTCAPELGSSTETSGPPEPTGSTPVRSQTGYPTMSRTG